MKKVDSHADHVQLGLKAVVAGEAPAMSDDGRDVLTSMSAVRAKLTVPEEDSVLIHRVRLLACRVVVDTM